ncbi:hypothetical protein TNCT_624131, partial [Trichonephila clavata]
MGMALIRPARMEKSHG